MNAIAPDHASRISRFAIARPAYAMSQAATLDWLARAHTEAETRAGGLCSEADAASFKHSLGKLLGRVACGPAQLAERGYEVRDCGHAEWDQMEIYDVHRDPRGAGTGARTALFARASLAAFERLYADRDEDPPQDLIHVTCTGYASPSAAQRLVALRDWGSRTRVTHAYHMGCYAALPAVRIASGLLASGLLAAERRPQRVDVVHTEVCSLHLQPRQHGAEQLVVQSLFADGHVRYAVERSRSDHPCLALLSDREVILPDCVDSMGWTSGDHGMQMSLARDVPSKISGGVRGFVDSLFADAGLALAAHRARTVFAVHPGGPRIIDAVQQALELRDDQVQASREVLRKFGNMSSATLPHVWRAIIADERVDPGTLVASLAFGPGLTVSGSLMVRENPP